MIIVHSAPVRRVAHHLAKLSAGQTIENEQLFELDTTTGSDAAWAGTEPTARPPRPGRLALSRPSRPVPGEIEAAIQAASLAGLPGAQQALPF
jgi:hypothetical protein